MNISRSIAFAIVVGCRCAAFNLNTRDINVSPSIREKSTLTTTSTNNNNISSNGLSNNSRRCTSLQVIHNSDNIDSIEPSERSIDISRRGMLTRCASVFTTAAFIWDRQQEVSYASEFSDGMQEPEDENPTISSDGGSSSQLSDETADGSQVLQQQQQQQQQEGGTIVSKEVTLENSQVVTIPTAKEIPAVWSAEIYNENSKPSPVIKTESDIIGLSPSEAKRKKNSLPVELAMTAGFFGSTLVAITGRVRGNTDPLTSKAKVVMITNEPYGLDIGRRFYNGVDITSNEPIPASDVREYCEPGKVNEDCVETIAGFLGEVQSNSQQPEGAPSMTQQETANAVLSYLDSLSSSRAYNPIQYHNNLDIAQSKRAMAFSNYLNVLSNGEVNAPASPQLVADYLASLSGVQDRMNALEQTVNRMPDEITGRLESWQEAQDEKLAKEINKIDEFLIKNDKNVNNRDDGVPELINDLESSFS